MLRAGYDFGAGAAELVAAFDQQPLRDRGVIDLDLPQAGVRCEHVLTAASQV